VAKLEDSSVVLHALWQSSNYLFKDADYKDFLRRDSFFSINDSDGKTFKIPLFRTFGDEDKEFKGGILHFLKHFQVNGQPATTGSQQHEFSIQTLLDSCEAFFF
jgi:hypothetical protein